MAPWHGAAGRARCAALLLIVAAGAAAAAAAAASGPGPGPGARVVSAQVVFRHGARTPLSTVFYGDVEWACDEAYPGADLNLTSPSGGAPPPLVDAADAPRLPGGCREGTLTQRGYRMALDLGAALRRRYVQQLRLLPEAAPPRRGAGAGAGAAEGLVVAHTTGYRRTVATLKGVLTGLFPDAPGPFHATLTEEREAYMYPSPRACGAISPVVQRLTQSADARESAAPQAPVARAREALGLPDDDPQQGGGAGPGPFKWYRLRDALACLLAERPEARPEGLDEGLWQLIQRRANDWETSIYAPGPWNCGAGDEEDCRRVIDFSIGPLLWRIVENMREAAAAAAAGADGWAGGGAAAAGPPPKAQPRLRLFSAHDTTVAPALAALGFEARDWPAFTANLAFELWLDGGGGSGGGGGGGGEPEEQQAHGAEGASEAAHALTAWVLVRYGGEPLPLRRSRAGAAPGAAAQAQPLDPHEHWRRVLQEQPREAQHLLADAGGGCGGDGDAGGADGGLDAGWITLDDLQERLRPFSLSDAAKEEACWPHGAGGPSGAR
ncbi:hypothetical protein Rsub_00072 [Raphidocelis subcapitata]|uniref:Lysophosphatidic acid phosphatase type 6 n=1 Tax=Raphidocelis subcapitata TaxID=307507 RepID=A0A2V0NJH2_9CHLO|nr:hypothetical protein Rsub_00072 [Raphidocelis subcapitata]|eukprot:GBF87361.1 hypothetical protein Rsub_00072 [Raphidocelis subcapitata]